jgi:hypothetical protein
VHGIGVTREERPATRREKRREEKGRGDAHSVIMIVIIMMARSGKEVRP